MYNKSGVVFVHHDKEKSEIVVSLTNGRRVSFPSTGILGVVPIVDGGFSIHVGDGTIWIYSVGGALCRKTSVAELSRTQEKLADGRRDTNSVVLRGQNGYFFVHHNNWLWWKESGDLASILEIGQCHDLIDSERESC